MSAFAMPGRSRPLAVVALAALGLAASMTGSAGAAPVRQDPEPEYVPCDPQGDRTMSPRWVEETGEITVETQYDYSCFSGIKPINFVLVVENTMPGEGGSPYDLLRNLKTGLSRFVSVTNYDNGTQGSMTLVGDQYTVRVPLQGGRDGKEALMNAIELISLKPVGNSAGFGQAIRDAIGRLPTNVEDQFENWVIVFDRGAPETTGSNPEPPVTRDEACTLAVAQKVNMIVVGHQDSGFRMVRCATRGYYASTGAKAPDLPELFDRVADRVLRGKQADTSEYVDYIDEDFVEFVNGSGQPRDPDRVLGSEIAWSTKDDKKPPSGLFYRYKLKAHRDTGLLPYIGDVTIDPLILMNWKDSSPSDEVMLPNPHVCIYRRGKESDCDGFRFSLTPTAVPGMETPTPTAPPPTTPPPSPTREPATLTPEQPTPTPEAPTDEPPTLTPVPTEEPLPRVLLPALLKQDNQGPAWP